MSRPGGSRPSPRFGPVSSAITPRTTWSCWPRLTGRTSGSAVRPPTPADKDHPLGTHLAGPHRAHQPVLHRLPQPLRQLPPALGPGRNPDRRQGTQTATLQEVANPVREAALTRPATAVPAPRTLDRRTQTRGRNHQRHRGCPAHAAGKKQHVRADKQVGVNPALKWKRLWK